MSLGDLSRVREAIPRKGCLNFRGSVVTLLLEDGLVNSKITRNTFISKTVTKLLLTHNNIDLGITEPDVHHFSTGKRCFSRGSQFGSSMGYISTQDFILISDSRFVTRDVAEFDGLVKAMVAGTIPVAWYFLTHLRVLRNLACSLRRFSNPLVIRYFSVVPSLLGDRAVKYALAPNRGNQCLVPKRRSDDYLREVMVDQLMSQDAAFDFSVQFQVDPKRMPIEDAGVTWDEKLSPFCKVATLTITSQVFDTPNRREFGDNLSFNPWRCLPEHRPLGGINRGRRQVYQSLSAFRHGVNQAVLQGPTVGMKASDP